MLIKRDTDLLLIIDTHLGIRNDRRKKHRMGSTAFGTFDATDTQTDSAFRKFYASAIVTMNGHAGRMTAGTRKLMKLNKIYDRIIKGLRNMVVILDKNGYHSIVNGHGLIHVCGEWRTGLS